MLPKPEYPYPEKLRQAWDLTIDASSTGHWRFEISGGQWPGERTAVSWRQGRNCMRKTAKTLKLISN